MVLALHIQLVHTFVEQMPSKTTFFPLYQSKTEYKLDLQLRNEKSCQKIRNTYFTSGCAIS